MEDYDNYVLDIQNTIWSNIPNFLFMVLISMFIIIGAQFIGAYKLEETKLLGMIVWMFSIIKLIGWIHLPNLEYKPRLTYNGYE